jgi:hypothetical protein
MKLGWFLLSSVVFLQKLKKKTCLVVKWDSIEKHISKIKVLDGKWFMDPKCGHAKNEIVYDQPSTTIVLQ